jgi:hypothetical protein
LLRMMSSRDKCGNHIYYVSVIVPYLLCTPKYQSNNPPLSCPLEPREPVAVNKLLAESYAPEQAVWSVGHGESSAIKVNLQAICNVVLIRFSSTIMRAM